MEHNASESKGNAMRGLAALKQASVSLARRHQNQEQVTRPAGEVSDVPASPTIESTPSDASTTTPGHHVSDPHQPLTHTASLANRGSTKKIPDPSELRLMDNLDIVPPSEGQSAPPPHNRTGKRHPSHDPSGPFSSRLPSIRPGIHPGGELGTFASQPLFKRKT
ncbi:MAG: hypothetical protein HQL77_08835 [Magnetococcales bacterium]|nr:hypothetical protein [Magnetococcales bacterium]